MKPALFLLLQALLAIGFPAFAADPDPLLNELKNHAARAPSTWSAMRGKAAGDRLMPAPDILIDYLRKDNELNGYPERPYAATVQPLFMKDFQAAIDELPEMAKAHLEKHVVGVFLVQALGTTGYGELLRDFEDNRSGFIVFDVDFLDRRANDWMSWRENSPFRDNGAFRIDAEIESERNDSRKSAIQYILLHELGHLVGVAKGAHPNWFDGGDPQRWPFAKLSWLTHKALMQGESKYDTVFPARKRVKFYAFQKAALSSEAIPDIYEKLQKTDFVSLYAATNMYDDFAETYTMYVHVILQNKPWTVRVVRKNTVVQEFSPPILEKRLAEKRQYMEALFR